MTEKAMYMNELLIFAKYPEPGKVKTRLAKDIGEQEAASAYKKMVECVIRNTRPTDNHYHCVVCYDPPEYREKFEFWFNRTLTICPPVIPDPFVIPAKAGIHADCAVGVDPRRSLPSTPIGGGDDKKGGGGHKNTLKPNNLRAQVGNNLGEKLQHALETSLSRATNAIVIGSDCLDIDSALIKNAFHHLSTSDIVLGPACDGGYYLIGCKKTYPELFTNITWGTEQVFTQTHERALSLNLAVSCLPQLEDIDEGEQFRRYSVILSEAKNPLLLRNRSGSFTEPVPAKAGAQDDKKAGSA